MEIGTGDSGTEGRVKCYQTYGSTRWKCDDDSQPVESLLPIVRSWVCHACWRITLTPNKKEALPSKTMLTLVKTSIRNQCEEIPPRQNFALFRNIAS